MSLALSSTNLEWVINGVLYNEETMSKAAIDKLCKLKQWHLRYSAFLMGLPSGGTKSDLAREIALAVQVPRPSKKAIQRVVSVDMGIRNLAYCVLDADIAKSPQAGPTSALVKTWKRVDLTAKGIEVGAASEDQRMEEELFKAPILAKVAYKTTRELLDYNPDVILIEQQRWRSGGGAGVQQWTIRVNTLESQLWACLRTLQESAPVNTRQFPMALQIDPKRVADFLPTSRDRILRFDDGIRDVGAYRAFEMWLKRAPDSTSGKKQKIDLVRSWLRDELSDDVSLSFEEIAAVTADSVCPQRSPQQLGHAGTKRSAGKIDDLADCLLQGVSWLRWQENRDTAWLEKQEAQNG